MKKGICMMLAAAMLFILCACSQKAAVQFRELQLGVEKEELENVLGNNYTTAGTVPDRMFYKNIALFDFLNARSDTKLTVNLNTENRAYAYSYYIYENLDSNYTRTKEYFEGIYGPASEGENASEIWIDGERTFYLFKQSDYVAIGVN